MKDLGSAVPRGAVEKGGQTTSCITATGGEPTLSLVRRPGGRELPFRDMVLSKQSYTERRRSLQLAPASALGAQVLVRLITAGAAASKISVSLHVCVLLVSPCHARVTPTEPCPNTKRGLPRRDSNIHQSPQSLYSDAEQCGGQQKKEKRSEHETQLRTGVQVR
ncbi:hypothetical protein JOB18_017074 [Solea senegalensis]|uniref:Uncharacterized protein n=1 Tax=Solea senegalensis TaxID=28829 RepID=A0AAV6Q8A2_SOLSE|nr:hypothetical protein JOB18_017074 [Solea senegalensis]